MDETVRKAIEAASIEELEEVNKYVQYRSSVLLNGDLLPSDYRFWRLLNDCLSGVVEERLSDASLHSFIVGARRTGGYGIRNYRSALERLNTYIDGGLGNRLLQNRAHRSRLMRTCIKALCTRLHHAGAPVTHASVLNSMLSLSSAMEWAFPGYYKAGRLDLIATKEETGVEN